MLRIDARPNNLRPAACCRVAHAQSLTQTTAAGWLAVIAIALALNLIVFATTFARAQTPSDEAIPGLLVPFGTDETTIRDAYKITGPLQFTGGNRRPTLRAQALGLWFFFDAKCLNDNIRVEAPFKGPVAGIAVGETLGALKSKRGNPVREPWNFGQDKAYLYDLNPIARVRYDVAPDGRIIRIYILLRQITS